MKRLVSYLVLFGVILYLAKAIAPLLILGVIGLAFLAWKRPDTVGRFTDRPQLARLPASVRATPMRFAGAVAFSAFVLIGITAPLGVAADDPDPSVMPSPVSRATATAEPTDSPTPRPTLAATPRPTATPEPTPAPGSAPTGPTEIGTVVAVTDGDTIRVDIDGVVYRVRYIGVSTPEIHDTVEWLGPEAAAANAELVEGRDVVLERDVSETDQFDRLLRHVWVEDGDGWLLVNLELVRLGFAQVTSYPPDVKYIDELYSPAQSEARDAGLGLWGTPPTPEPTPQPTPAPTAAPVAPLPVVPQPTAAPASNCHPSYTGACLTPGIGDYDCAGGSGNGPNYTGRVNVVGYDEFDLDRDGDGVGCDT